MYLMIHTHLMIRDPRTFVDPHIPQYPRTFVDPHIPPYPRTSPRTLDDPCLFDDSQTFDD
jgi:hypothetical protein